MNIKTKILIGVFIAAMITVILGVVLFYGVSNRSTFGCGSNPFAGCEQEPPHDLCDLNRDGVCNATDYDLFQKVKGQCRTNFTTIYSIYADVDADGCVTDYDEQLLFPTTKPK
ncbi:MAG TPA: dockerin type I domain-containing protein [Candidatus Nanoarchaeia archaeon]|nr:dockerin type I domain-containing protein [Candidatus Nanoarchaeia archaeon]